MDRVMKGKPPSSFLFGSAEQPISRLWLSTLYNGPPLTPPYHPFYRLDSDDQPKGKVWTHWLLYICNGSPLSSIAEVKGWVRNGSTTEQREKPGDGHASCHSIQRRLTPEELICYLQGLCTHLWGIASARALSLLTVATRHRHSVVQRSSGAFFFFLRLSENNAKYGRMEREQQDLSLKDEGIHVSDGKCKEAVRLAFILKICFHSSVNESNKDLFIYVFILQHMFKFKIFPPICVQLLVTVCSYFYLHFFQYCRLYLIETQTILFRHCTVR